jgi:hypothetical protein
MRFRERIVQIPRWVSSKRPPAIAPLATRGNALLRAVHVQRIGDVEQMVTSFRADPDRQRKVEPSRHLGEDRGSERRARRRGWERV